MANDNLLFLRDLGVFVEADSVLFGVVLGCFRLVALDLVERLGVLEDFLLDLGGETKSKRHGEKIKFFFFVNG